MPPQRQSSKVPAVSAPALTRPQYWAGTVLFYVVNSLELYLFFDRIMKEHAFFLKVGFLPPNAGFAKENEELLKRFEGILSRAIRLSDRIVRRSVLESGEICTEFTAQAEAQTQRLTGTAINRQLTVQVGQLRGISCDRELRVNRNLTQQAS